MTMIATPLCKDDDAKSEGKLGTMRHTLHLAATGFNGIDDPECFRDDDFCRFGDTRINEEPNQFSAMTFAKIRGTLYIGQDLLYADFCGVPLYDARSNNHLGAGRCNGNHRWSIYGVQHEKEEKKYKKSPRLRWEGRLSSGEDCYLTPSRPSAVRRRERRPRAMD